MAKQKKNKYIVRDGNNILHDEKQYVGGDTIFLTDEQALQLVNNVDPQPDDPEPLPIVAQETEM